jgi:hypothetical protein
MPINATANPIQPTAGQPALLRLPNLRQELTDGPRRLRWSFAKTFSANQPIAYSIHTSM